MITTRELCHALSATLHLPGVDRWAKHLETRELLPGLDHQVCALDAALLLAAVVAATARPRLQGRYLPDGHFDARKAAETLGFSGPLWHMEEIAP